MISRIPTVPRRIGTMTPSARNRPRKTLPRKRYSVSAKAAIAPNSRMKKIEPTVTMRLLKK